MGKKSRRAPKDLRQQALLSVPQTNATNGNWSDFHTATDNSWGADDTSDLDYETASLGAGSMMSDFNLSHEELQQFVQPELGHSAVDKQMAIVDEALEFCAEKRSTQRMLGLKTLLRVSQGSVLTEVYDERRDSIVSAITASVRKGDSQERSLAAAAAAAFLLQSADEGHHEDLMSKMGEVLMVVAQDPSADDGERAACIMSLSWIMVIACPEEDRVVALAHKFADLFGPKGNGSQIKRAALQGFALILTRIEDDDVEQIYLEEFQRIVATLRDTDLMTRVNAGEALALLFEKMREHNEDALNSFDQSELNDTLEQLVKESSKRVSKKDKAKQKAAFRDIARGIRDGDVPSETLKLAKEDYEVESWEDYVQLQGLRRVLAGGMLIHLNGNNFVRSLLGLPDAELGQERTGIDLRQKADEAKAKKLDRARGRQNKYSAGMV
eukprot:Clim_evm7s54 gene=Clim_evmTU7s54